MIDYEFVAKMLKKQATHYAGFIRATERQIEDYDRQLHSFEKLIAHGDTKWEGRRKEVSFKKTEAISKLSDATVTYSKIKSHLEEPELSFSQTQEEDRKGFGFV